MERAAAGGSGRTWRHPGFVWKEGKLAGPDGASGEKGRRGVEVSRRQWAVCPRADMRQDLMCVWVRRLLAGRHTLLALGHECWAGWDVVRALPCGCRKEKPPNRLLLLVGPKGAEFGGFPEMKLSEILTPNMRTQAGRGVGPGPFPGVCSFAEGVTSGHVSQA